MGGNAYAGREEVRYIGGAPQVKPRHYFPMPNEIFHLELSSGAILVYAYLMYCEDRKTYTCHPSYSTIGRAIKRSHNSVAKYVRELEDKCLIYTEPTEVTLKDGRRHNGTLRYTIRPITDAVAYHDAVQMQRLLEESARAEAQKRLEEYDRRHGKREISGDSGKTYFEAG